MRNQADNAACRAWLALGSCARISRYFYTHVEAAVAGLPTPCTTDICALLLGLYI
jgi:hypothetical protein